MKYLQKYENYIVKDIDINNDNDCTYQTSIKQRGVKELLKDKNIDWDEYKNGFDSIQDFFKKSIDDQLGKNWGKKFLESYGDQDTKNISLYNAVNDNRLDFIKNLISKGADVNYRKNKVNNVLELATQNSNIAAMKLLLKAGAKITPDTIEYSIQRGYDLVKLLLDYGMDVNQKFNTHGESTLMLAINEHDLNIAILLLDNGVDIEHKDSYNHTAVDLNFSMDITIELIKRGAILNRLFWEEINTSLYEIQKAILEYQPSEIPNLLKYVEEDDLKRIKEDYPDEFDSSELGLL